MKIDSGFQLSFLFNVFYLKPQTLNFQFSVFHFQFSFGRSVSAYSSAVGLSAISLLALLSHRSQRMPLQSLTRRGNLIRGAASKVAETRSHNASLPLEKIRGGDMFRGDARKGGAKGRRRKTEKPQRNAEASVIGWRRPTFPQLNAVSSALRGLTSLFGMGRGGPPRYSHHVYLYMS